MRRKLFPTLLRLTASLIFVLGISYSYAQAYDATRGSYAAESTGHYQRYFGEYKYRNYAMTKAAQYKQSYAKEYLDKYNAAMLTRYSNYVGRYGNDYSGRYSDNYSNRYVDYTKDSNYSLHRPGGYQHGDYATEKEIPYSVGYAIWYATYQYGGSESSLTSYSRGLIGIDTATSIARYDSGLQMRANA
jgi:hypothetical protein